VVLPGQPGTARGGGAEHVYAAVIGDQVPHLHVHLLPGTRAPRGSTRGTGSTRGQRLAATVNQRSPPWSAACTNTSGPRPMSDRPFSPTGRSQERTPPFKRPSRGRGNAGSSFQGASAGAGAIAEAANRMRHDRDSTSGCPLGERSPDTTSTSLRRTSSTETAPTIHGSRRQHHLRPDANPSRSSDAERTLRETGHRRLPSWLSPAAPSLTGCRKTIVCMNRQINV